MGLDAIYDINSTFPNYEVGWFNSSDHPGLPGEIYGYRFWGDSLSTSEFISFEANFLPMWGDFFSSGLDSMDYAWNEGFPNPDPPYTDVGDGSLQGHILVPGAGGVAILPEPNSNSFLFVVAAIVLLPARYRSNFVP